MTDKHFAERYALQAHALGKKLATAGLSQELIDEIDDHLLEGLWMAFCGGHNTISRDNISPIDLINMGLAIPITPSAADTSNIAGWHEPWPTQLTVRDKTGKIVGRRET